MRQCEANAVWSGNETFCQGTFTGITSKNHFSLMGKREIRSCKSLETAAAAQPTTYLKGLVIDESKEEIKLPVVGHFNRHNNLIYNFLRAQPSK